MNVCHWTRCGGRLAALSLLVHGVGSGACVLASPDFDAPTESDAAASASTPGSAGESESGGVTGAPTASSGSAGTGTGGQTTGTTTVGTTTAGTTTGTTEASSTGTTTEAPTTSGTTEGGGLCDLSPGAWSVGEAVPLSELNTQYTEGDPVLLGDGKTLLFSSNRLGGFGSFDSYYAVRSGVGEPFGPAVNVEAEYGWNDVTDEGKAELTENNLEVVLSSSYGGPYRLWSSVRISTDVVFPGYTLISTLSQHPGPTLDPHLSDDGLRVYFARQAMGHYDLFMVERAQLGGDFGGAIPLSELNTGMSEANPSLSDDQTLIVFARRVGDQIDLFYAHRPDAGATFGRAEPLTALNTGFDDAEPFLVEHDGQCELLFASDRGDGPDWDLYRAPIVSN